MKRAGSDVCKYTQTDRHTNANDRSLKLCKANIKSNEITNREYRILN